MEKGFKKLKDLEEISLMIFLWEFNVEITTAVDWNKCRIYNIHRKSIKHIFDLTTSLIKVPIRINFNLCSLIKTINHRMSTQ